MRCSKEVLMMSTNKEAILGNNVFTTKLLISSTPRAKDFNDFAVLITSSSQTVENKIYEWMVETCCIDFRVFLL